MFWGVITSENKYYLIHVCLQWSAKFETNFVTGRLMWIFESKIFKVTALMIQRIKREREQFWNHVLKLPRLWPGDYYYYYYYNDWKLFKNHADLCTYEYVVKSSYLVEILSPLCTYSRVWICQSLWRQKLSESAYPRTDRIK